MLWHLTKHCLTNSTCQVEESIQRAWKKENPVFESCRASCHFALESCVINSTCSASTHTTLPSGNLPSQGDSSLSGWYRRSICLTLLLFIINNKVAFFFFSYITVLWVLLAWVCFLGPVNEIGIRVCKAHQGKCYLVGICWSGLLDSQVMPIRMVMIDLLKCMLWIISAKNEQNQSWKKITLQISTSRIILQKLQKTEMHPQNQAMWKISTSFLLRLRNPIFQFHSAGTIKPCSLIWWPFTACLLTRCILSTKCREHRYKVQNAFPALESALARSKANR